MISLLMAAALLGGGGTAADVEKILKDGKLGLADACARAVQEVPGGIVLEAELELRKGEPVFAVEVADGTKKLEILYQARDGRLLARKPRKGDPSALARSVTVSMTDALAAARMETKGHAVAARLAKADGKSFVQVLAVRDARLWGADLDAQGKVLRVAEVKIPGVLGVRLEKAGSEVRIGDVQPDSAAARAGLQKGDVIASVQGQKVESLDALQKVLFGMGRGAEARIEYVRQGRPGTVTAILGERPIVEDEDDEDDDDEDDDDDDDDEDDD